MVREVHRKSVNFYPSQGIFSSDLVLLPCLQTILVSDRDSRTVIGRTRHVTSPVWSRIDWLTGPKIRIVGLSFAEVEMDKIVRLEFHLRLSGRSKHQVQ